MKECKTQEPDGAAWVELTGSETGGAPGPLSERRARSWGLVLTANRIPYRLEEGAGGRRLWVPPALRERALAELGRFEAENRDWPPPPETEAVGLVDKPPVTVPVLVALAPFYPSLLPILPVPPVRLHLGEPSLCGCQVERGRARASRRGASTRGRRRYCSDAGNRDNSPPAHEITHTASERRANVERAHTCSLPHRVRRNVAPGFCTSFRRE